MDGGDPKCYQFGLPCPCSESQRISRVLMAGRDTCVDCFSSGDFPGRHFLSSVLMKPSKINTCLSGKQNNTWFHSDSHLSPQNHFKPCLRSCQFLIGTGPHPCLQRGWRLGRRALGGLSSACASIKTLSRIERRMTFPSATAP